MVSNIVVAVEAEIDVLERRLGKLREIRRLAVELDGARLPAAAAPIREAQPKAAELRRKYASRSGAEGGGWAALQPTVTELQRSAFDLLDRMLPTEAIALPAAPDAELVCASEAP